ncbi:hypothetical protein MLD38_028925 [Melastoma candidum]|uniref:Uncharacterized protein n=1 Tax=Melastoma candidum TaxID=119954 RepID=A0ACB9N253_9MYRT|nr:hypothetical protein MLD38_028925 [Melastoma candidum]
MICKMPSMKSTFLKTLCTHKFIPPLRNLAASSRTAVAFPGRFGDRGYSTWGSVSASRESYSPPDTRLPVVTTYDPATGRVVTRRIADGAASANIGKDVGSGSEEEGDGAGLEGVGERRVYGKVWRQNLGFGKSKKGKSKVFWVCDVCGHEDGQWWGTCRACDRVGTLKRFSVDDGGGGGGNGNRMSGFEVTENAARTWLPQKRAGEVQPLKLKDVNRGSNGTQWRIPLNGRFGDEVSRVLGGGLVPGSLVLIGGDPGIGKSTLLLQIAAMIAEGNEMVPPAPVVYVSGEESVEQISNRADRLSIETEHLYLYSSTDIEDIFDKIQVLSPRALVVDSIQTVYLNGVTGSAGGLSQLRECTSALLRFAKKTNVPVLLIGHVTKSGEIAGPRMLEHIVDVVLYLEGEKHNSHRLLRSVKNRFGTTDELGVLEMLESGLRAVVNPNEILLREDHAESEVLAGLAVSAIMDGSRTFLIEIQALCLSSSTTSRQVNGIQPSRADMIISVLVKQAGLKLQENAIFLNVVSGVTLTETAGDLAIAAAICSSFLEFPIPRGIAFIGEIGLGGELHVVPRMEKRVNTVAKLGYKKCVVPKTAEKALGGLAVAICQANVGGESNC